MVFSHFDPHQIDFTKAKLYFVLSILKDVKKKTHLDIPKKRYIIYFGHEYSFQWKKNLFD